MKLSLDQVRDIPAQIQAFKTYYSRLTERERYMVLATIGGGILFLMIVIYTTFMTITVRMAGRIEKGRENLVKIQEYRSRYVQTERQVQQMEGMIRRTPPGFQLLSHLEKLAQKNGVTKIDNAREISTASTTNDLYKEIQVSLTVNKIPLRTLINFLHDIENGEQLMRISTIKIKPDFQDPTTMRVDFTVSTFQPVQGS